MTEVPERTIFKIYNAVIGASSEHETSSPCPPREKFTWRKVWQKFSKPEDRYVHQIDEYDDTDQNDNEEEEEEKNKTTDPPALCNTVFCSIKMQDPCEICCCTVCKEEKDSPCTGVPRGMRPPICDCKPHEKYKNDYKCCDACEHHGLKRV